MVIANEINKAIQLKLFIATYVMVIFNYLFLSLKKKDCKTAIRNVNSNNYLEFWEILNLLDVSVKIVLDCQQAVKVIS